MKGLDVWTAYGISGNKPGYRGKVGELFPGQPRPGHPERPATLTGVDSRNAIARRTRSECT